MSQFFVCLPTFELTTFEQHLWSIKTGYANALLLETNSYKKTRNVATLNSAHQAKKQCNFDSGWLERQHCDLNSFFWILWTWEICSVPQKSWKKIYSRTTTKSVPLLQSEHGFCQQNGQGCDQVLVSKWKNSRGSRLF